MHVLSNSEVEEYLNTELRVTNVFITYNVEHILNEIFDNVNGFAAALWIQLNDSNVYIIWCTQGGMPDPQDNITPTIGEPIIINKVPPIRNSDLYSLDYVSKDRSPLTPLTCEGFVELTLAEVISLTV